MCLNTSSKHYDDYYNYVLNHKKVSDNIGKIYDIISDISNRRGLRQEWEQIDGDIQDEIIDKWMEIIDRS